MIEVMLLTQEQCTFCTEAKALLERLAVAYPLSISMLDVASPEGQALALRSGMLFPPGLLLDNEAFSYGRVSERKLRREIERRLRTQQGV